MKKPRSGGRGKRKKKKKERKKRCRELCLAEGGEDGQKLLKELSGGTVTPAGQVRTDLFLPLQETQTWGRTDALRLF